MGVCGPVHVLQQSIRNDVIIIQKSTKHFIARAPCASESENGWMAIKHPASVQQRQRRGSLPPDPLGAQLHCTNRVNLISIIYDTFTVQG